MGRDPHRAQSMSLASTARCSRFAAAIARMPLPVPMSSGRSNRRRRARLSSAKRQPRVEGCSPVPNAVAASISMAIAPAGLAGSPGPGQCEPCTRNRPIRSGGNARRFSASQSRSGNLSSTM
jgi:hypothetical protein